jgi:ribosome biogenesis GTPase A
MEKARRQMTERLKACDMVIELRDARIPQASMNPLLRSISGNKPRLIVLNRMDLADPEATKKWLAYYKSKGFAALTTDCKSKKGISDFVPAVRSVLKEKIQRNEARGMHKALKIMIVGIPNVGKSTFINQISGRKGAKAENRPGVTRGKQWVTVDNSLLLLDTPGILWPKFEDPEVGMKLAYTGAVKENVIDTEELACHLMELFRRYYPQILTERYKIQPTDDMPGYMLLEQAGRKRGYLLARGEINTERAAKVLLDEYRSGKLGRLTFELPEESV